MKSLIITSICFFLFSWAYAEEARLLRFPHIQGDQVVFSYAGDLYTTGLKGGQARKLTSDKGYEMFPRLSPDGKYIAFTGQYDGNTEVFVIPSQGGEPKRLTFTATLDRDDLGDRMGPNNIVIGWTPDSKNILFRTRQFTFNDFTGQLMTVPVEGGDAVEIPLKNGGFASYSPDGKKWRTIMYSGNSGPGKDIREGWPTTFGSLTSIPKNRKRSPIINARTSSRCGLPTAGKFILSLTATTS